MNQLFEKTTINGMQLDNRFIRSATWEGMAEEDGKVTGQLIDTMAALANGGIGLIISSHAYVQASGQASPHQLGIHDDETIPGYVEMTRTVHRLGGKIVLQLAHAGERAPRKLTGAEPLNVSGMEAKGEKPPLVQATATDIEAIVNDFSLAALRAQRSGFDGVQIHSAHGYLLSQFLSPIYNRRRDGYGGDVANRCRIHLEILAAIRARLGSGFPVLIKMNCADFAEGGLTVNDSMIVAKKLAAAGIDAIEISGGLPTSGRLVPTRTGINTIQQEAYFRKEAGMIRSNLTIPLMLVGGIRTFSLAREIIESGEADYISLCRPLIREPGLINRWKKGDLSRSKCLSDNLCFRPAMKGEGIYCVPDRQQGSYT